MKLLVAKANVFIKTTTSAALINAATPKNPTVPFTVFVATVVKARWRLIIILIISGKVWWVKVLIIIRFLCLLKEPNWLSWLLLCGIYTLTTPFYRAKRI